MSLFKLALSAVLAVGTASSAMILPDSSVHVQGVDVRNKKEKYLLILSKENIVLEERHYKVMKVVGHKKQLVAEGDAVLTGADPQHDTEAVWQNENTELRIGKMVGYTTPRQIIVLKLKDTNQTFAFELYQQ